MKFFPTPAMAALCAIGAFCFLLRGPVQLRAKTQAASSLQPDNAERGNPAFPQVFLRDVVVSNTDPDLKNTDKFYNSEPGIAVDPTDPRRIVISAFSGSWSLLDNGTQFRPASLWYSRNGGQWWTKEYAISPPPGVRKGVLVESPCDITFDYGRDGLLYGTFLLDASGEEGGGCSGPAETEDALPEAAENGEIVSGATADPAHAGAWQWLTLGGITQPTNHHHPADQPWIVVNQDPSHLRSDRVYVAYQSSAMQVAAAEAKPPLDFTLDSSPGPSTQFGGNPGLRIAADHRSGAIYSIHETAAPIECSSSSPIDYVLNRSVDGGATWELNGSRDGISVAQVCSHQNIYTYGFGEPFPGAILGGVNRLRGGIDALAVDSKTGDVYVVYGVFDEAVDRDRIAVVRLVNRGNGWMELGHPRFVSGTEHQSALPAVAVNDKGTVAVLYDTADGLDEETSRPYFSVHLAASEDHGTSFRRVLLQKFLLPDNTQGGNAGPRPLGDYQQLKSFHNAFYGVFAGDGRPFGRPFHKIDPIFVKTSVP